MRCLTVLSIALVGITRWAQVSPVEVKDNKAAIEFAQQAVVRALNYTQGDRPSLLDAQDDFTADGWREFMKWMDGWLDSKGAPLGSSTFTPTGKPVLSDPVNGLLHLTIPGALKQSQNTSSTTYRLVVDIRVAGNPPKIAYLKPTVELKVQIP